MLQVTARSSTRGARILFLRIWFLLWNIMCETFFLFYPQPLEMNAFSTVLPQVENSRGFSSITIHKFLSSVHNSMPFLKCICNLGVKRKALIRWRAVLSFLAKGHRGHIIAFSTVVSFETTHIFRRAASTDNSACAYMVWGRALQIQS